MRQQLIKHQIVLFDAWRKWCDRIRKNKDDDDHWSDYPYAVL
jgi:hypothetical protein